ncbi:MAG: tetratricopeptide repeat protein [bacterium]
MSYPASDEPVIALLPPNALWAKYKFIVLGVTALFAIALIFAIGHINRRRAEKIKAAELYAQASTTEKWQEVVDKYPKSSEAAQSLLRLAADAQEKKQWDQAVSFYRQLFQSFPQHPLASAAELAAASCLEAGGKMDEARQTYFQITQNAQHPFFGAASIGLARLYQAQGNIPRARQVLKEFINRNRPSRFLQEAQAMLAQLPE